MPHNHGNKKPSLAARIRKMLDADQTTRAIAVAVGCTETYVRATRSRQLCKFRTGVVTSARQRYTARMRYRRRYQTDPEFRARVQADMRRRYANATKTDSGEARS